MLDEVNDEEKHALQHGKLQETFQMVSSIFQIKACRNSAAFSFTMNHDTGHDFRICGSLINYATLSNMCEVICCLYGMSEFHYETHTQHRQRMTNPNVFSIAC